MTCGWMRQGRSGVVTATVVVGAVAILLGLFVLGGAAGFDDTASTAPDQRYIEGSSLSSTESGGDEVFATTVVDPRSVDISTDEPTATAASQESVSSSPDPLPNLVANLSEAEGRLGEVVSVDLDVTSLGGTGGDEVGSYSFVLSYDSGVLAFDSVEGAGWSDPVSANDNGGTVAVADFDVTDQTPTEPALRFNFEIVGSGMSNITFDDDAPGIPAQNIINNGEAYTYAVQYESGGAGTGGEPLETTTVQRSPSFSSSDVASKLPDVAVGDANTQNGVEISDAQNIAQWLVGIDVSPFNEYVANATRETPSGGTGVQIGDAQRIADYVTDFSGVFVPDANITGFEPSETLTAGNSITESGVVKNDGGFGSIQEVYYRIADSSSFANVVYEKRLVIADLAPTGFDGNTTAFSLDIDPSLPAGDYAQRLVTEGIPPQDEDVNASVTTDLTIEPAGPDSASIVTEPGETTAGESISGAPEVSVVDEFGNEVPGVNVTVTASGPGSLTDGSTTTVQTDAEGNATFDSLVLETAGAYTLTFDAENVSGSLQTEAFNVSAAGADSVTVETQPTDTTAGEIIGGSPAANVTDAFGNAVEGVDVTVSSVDAGTTTRTTGADGIATFDDLNITTAGTTTLTFDAENVAESATTDSFEVTPAAVASVEISPDSDQTVAAGEELAFSATAKDEFGNVNESADSAFDWAGVTNISTTGLFNETSAAESGTDYDVTATIEGVSSAATTVTVEPAAVTNVTLSPTSDQTVTAGETVAFSATASDQFGNVNESADSAFDWDASGGLIAGDGLFEETGAAESGSDYDVTATLGSVSSVATTVTVNPAAVDTVTISPDSDQTVAAGEEIAFSATALDQFGNVVESDDSAFDWAGVTNISTTGLFNETSAAEFGTNYDVTATIDGVSSAATTVTVEPAAVESVTMSNSPASQVTAADTVTMTAGEKLQFDATAYDRYGNVNESTESNFTWAPSSGGMGGDGLFAPTTAAEDGTDYDVTASLAEVTSPVTTVTVTPANVSSVTISPASDQTLAAGEEIAFSATATDEFGNVNESDDSAFTWSGGSIAGDGLFNQTSVPESGASYDVTAKLDGVESSATAVTVNPTAVSRVEITPASDQTVAAGEEIAFSATAYDQFDNVVESDDSAFTWSGGSIAGDGLFNETSVPASGANYDVTATLDTVSSSATTVTVNPAAVDTVTISPTSTTVTAGVAGATDFDATATDQYGNVITSSDSDFTWTAGTGSVDTSGVYDAPNSAGSYSGEVTAEYNGVSSSADVTVNPASVSSVEISPTSTTVTAGVSGATEFGATAKDQYGNVITSADGDFSWSAGTGAVDGSGVYDAPTSAGSYSGEVTASYSGVSASADVTVNPASVSSVEISPTSTTVTAGVASATDFGATAKDQYGNVITSSDGDFTWTAGAGSVDSTGVYDAPTSAGSYSGEVTAAYNGVSSSADVTVTPASVSTVEISPTSTTVTAGVAGATDFDATATDQYGNVITSSDSDFTWTADTGSVDTSGVYDAPNSAGSYSGEVTASYSGVSSSADVTVNPASVSSVEISPTSTTVTAGVAGATDFGATAKDQYGNVITSADGDFSWSAGTGAVDGSGVYDAPTSAGSYSGEVTASYSGVSSSADVTVNPASVSTVSISPTSTTVTAGVAGAAEFAATAEDQYGNVITAADGDFSWSAGAGTVGGTGSYDAPTSAGSYSNEVTATYNGVSASADVTVNPDSVSTVEISPTSTTVTAGVAGAADFDATAKDQYGNVITSSDGDFSWTVGQGSVDSSGVYDAPTSAGSYSGEVTATYNGVSTSADVTVEPASVSSVSISPTSATVTAGVAGAADFGATAVDQYGNVITAADGDFTWSAGAGSVDTSGVYDAPNSAGSYSGEVTAAYNGVSASADVTVTPDSVDSVAISPSSSQTVEAGQTLEFSATATDQYGNTITSNDGDFSWSGTDSTGSFQETTASTYSVSASYNGVSSTAVSVDVTPAPVDSVSINPNSAQTVDAGQTLGFSATAADQYGNVITSNAGDFSWSGTDSTGTFQETSVGTYSVSASYNGVSSTTVSVDVTPAPVDSVSINPNSAQTVDAGQTLEFSATAADQYGNTITSNDGDFSWSGTDSTGTFQETSASTYTVSVSYNGVSSTTVSVDVTPASVSTVTISPSAPTVEPSTSNAVDFSATAVDQYGNTITATDSDFTWSATGGTVGGSGSYDSPSSSGTETVTAAYNGASADATVTVQAPANFAVTITTTNSPVVEGDTLNIEAFIENTGDVQGTQTISLSSNLGSDSTTLTLGGGNSQLVTLSVSTGSGDAGSYNPTVSSADASDSASVTVNAPANFAVTITNAPDVVEGETLTVEAFIDNTGGVSDTQTISLSSGLGSASTSVTLGSGNSQFVTLSVGTGSGDAGSYNPTVSSADASDSASVTVNEPASFSVSFSSLPGTITQGENLDVSVQVSNNGGVSGSTDVTVNPGNLGNSKTTSSVSVGAGGSQSVSFTFGTTKSDGGRSYTVDASVTGDSASGSVTVDAPTIDFTVRLANDGDSKTGSTEVFVDETPNRYNPLFSQSVGVRTAGPAALYTGGASLADVTKTLLSGQENDSSEGETSPERDDGNRTSGGEDNNGTSSEPGDGNSVAPDDPTSPSQPVERVEEGERDQENRFNESNVQTIDPDDFEGNRITLDEPGVYATDISDYDYVKVKLEGGGGGAGESGNGHDEAGGGDGGSVEGVWNVDGDNDLTTSVGSRGGDGDVGFDEGPGSEGGGYHDGGNGGFDDQFGGGKAAGGGGGGSTALEIDNELFALAAGGGGGGSVYSAADVDAGAGGGGGGNDASGGDGDGGSNDGGSASSSKIGSDVFGGLGGGAYDGWRNDAYPGNDGGWAYYGALSGTGSGSTGGGGDGGGASEGKGEDGSATVILPDISASASAPSTVEPGDSVTISYTLSNSADVKGKEDDVDLYVDGGYEGDDGSKTVPANGDASGTLSFTVDNSKSDGDTINYRVDLDDFPGGDYYGSIDVVEPPDPQVTDITANPSSGNPGDTVTFEISVTNYGGDMSSSENIDIDLENAAGSIGYAGNVELNGGQSTTINYDYTLESGDKPSFTAWSGVGNIQVGDSNTETTTVSVTIPPDPQVTDITANPSSGAPGDQITFEVTVENFGGDMSSTEDVDIDLDDDAGGSIGYAGDVQLNAGDTTTLTEDYTLQSGDKPSFTAWSGMGNIQNGDSGIETTDVTVQDPANFDVSITGTNEPILEGDTLNVDVRIENTGDVQDTQNIDLSSSLGSDTIFSLTLSGGQVETRTLSVGTSSGDAGSYNPTVSSDDTSDSTSVQVDEPAFFDVSIQSVNSPVEGNNLDVTVNIDNTGDRSATQTINLDVPGLGSDSTGVFLSGGGSTTQTLSVSTGSGDAGSYTAEVTSDDDTATQGVTVKAPANLQVKSLSYPNEIASGNTLNIDVTVENTGDVSGGDTIELVIDGTVEDSIPVSVSGNSETTKTLSYGQTSSVVQALVDAGLLDITEEESEDSTTESLPPALPTGTP